jgi:alkylation response protein AidB-like acyl-CoA dehydrogenase
MSGLDYERAVLVRRADRHHAGLHGRGHALCPRAQAVRPAIGEFQLIQGKIADMYTR